MPYWLQMAAVTFCGAFIGNMIVVAIILTAEHFAARKERRRRP